MVSFTCCHGYYIVDSHDWTSTVADKEGKDQPEVDFENNIPDLSKATFILQCNVTSILIMYLPTQHCTSSFAAVSLCSELVWRWKYRYCNLPQLRCGTSGVKEPGPIASDFFQTC